jgi:spermidine/putrescine transport system substrate-binding protein
MKELDLDRVLRGRLSRREILQAGGGAALAAYGLSGCTVSRPVETADAGAIVRPKIDGDLLIYNWAQYMDPALKKEFAEHYDVEVNEVNFDNLEAMVVKLRSGGEYDLIWPSTEYVARLAAEGLLMRFDRDDLKNSKNISPFYDSPWWDPNNELSIPYAYYTTGICWRNDVVTDMTGSWNDLLNPAGAGRMFILDDFQEAIGEANLIHGWELNTEDENELEISKETLLEQKENARGFSTNSVQNLVNGTAVLHQAWNGDVVNVRNQVDQPELYSYETCTEGVPVGTDLMCIPSTARSPGTALMFMDWIIEPDNAFRNVMWNGYPQPVEGGQQAFADLVKEEPSIDVDLQALENSALEYRLDSPEARQLWTQIFTEVKAS